MSDVKRSEVRALARAIKKLQSETQDRIQELRDQAEELWDQFGGKSNKPPKSNPPKSNPPNPDPDGDDDPDDDDSGHPLF